MNFFRNLFGRKKPNSPKSEPLPTPPPEEEKPETTEMKNPLHEAIPEIGYDPKEYFEGPIREGENREQAFGRELQDAAKRYFGNPGFSMEITPTHPVTKEEMTFEAGFNATFSEWIEILSPWDRRKVLFEMLDEMLLPNIEPFRALNRFITDRLPDTALKFISDHNFDEKTDDPDMMEVIARTYFCMSDYEEAEKFARLCLDTDPLHHRGRITFGDICHFTGKENEGHEKWNSILKEKLPQAIDPDQKTIGLGEIVGFHANILNSPIFTLNYLLTNPEGEDEDFWKWASNEFYWSPQFRSQHAFHLLKNSDQLTQVRGLAKLVTLAQEMPWFKEAVLNAVSVINQMAIPGFMEKEADEFLEIIEKNGWSLDDLKGHKHKH